MISRLRLRCSASRRLSAPLATKRSRRRSALSRSVGAGQEGSAAASAARAPANGNGGGSPARSGISFAPSRRSSCTAERNGSSRPSSRWCAIAVMKTVLPPPRRPVTASRRVRSSARSARSWAWRCRAPKAPGSPARRALRGPSARTWRTGSPSPRSPYQCPARIATNTRKPASRLLRKRRRHDAGSSMSRVRICQAKCSAGSARAG